MRRILLLASVAAAAAGCVSVDGPPDPHGALKTGQRVVVAVYPSPGPWIIGATDSKAEAAGKITPLGFLIQTAEDSRTLAVSKNLQQYLPRPRLADAVQETLLKALRTARSTDTVQTTTEAGIPIAQLREWNKSTDQLDWRQRYYFPDPDAPAPRDYARILTLDDALILDVNVSFGTDANDSGNVMPQMSAATRVYRGDTSHLLWTHEDVVTDQTSSSTLTDYQVSPWTLTDSLTKLAPTLGTNIATAFLAALTVAPSTSAVHLLPPRPSSSSGGGLVSMSAFQNLGSTAAPAGIAPAAPAVAPSPAAGVAVSSSPVSAASSSTAVSPPAAPPPAAPVIISTPAVPASALPPPAAPH
jgi:hypothetical protein